MLSSSPESTVENRSVKGDQSASAGRPSRGGFCHLHVHTHYSALDGACKVEDVVGRAVEFGMPALAITDHGMLSGAIQFYQQCLKAGIKPIIGLETYVVQDRFHKDAQTEERWHLTLLAENETGYRNLLKLGSLSFLEGYYFKPRVDYDSLKQHSEGIICLSGCPSGRLSRALQHGQIAAADAEVVRKRISTWRSRRRALRNWRR